MWSSHLWKTMILLNLYPWNVTFARTQQYISLQKGLQSKNTPFHGVFVSQLVWDALSDGVKMVCSCAVGRELKGSFHSWGEMRERAGSLQPLIQHTTTQAPPTHSNALSMTPGSRTETQNLKQIYKASFSGWIPHILNHKQLSNFPK